MYLAPLLWFAALAAHPVIFDDDPPVRGYSALLARHVDRQGYVDYAGLRKDQKIVERFIQSLWRLQLDQLTPNEKLATLINAYNACTLKLVLDERPAQSINDIPEERRWQDRRWRIGGRHVSLEQLKDEWIRADFGDPRVHFALCNATVGSPPLRSEAYTAEQLDAQLNDQGRRVHADARWFRFDADANTVYLSRVYEWYEADFRAVGAGSVVEYARRFALALQTPRETMEVPTVRYLEWDWKLNRKSR